jgi:hypothetical protein
MRRGFLFLAGSLALLTAVSAQGAGTAPRAEILVLGTYHMDNPGLDVFNVEADDVLSAKRQAEIEALVEVLARFEPTAIAVEAPIGSERVAREYADHRAGKYALSRNEIDQIGYRLAARLGHAVVHPVDVAGDFPFEGVQRFARANGREAELESLMADTGRRVKAQGEYFATHSVLDALRRINDDAHVREDQSFYARLMSFGAPGDWAGADLNAAWYRRNARIFSQILKLSAKPGARVLVIYGAGHLALLRQFVAADRTLVLRSLEDVAGP